MRRAASGSLQHLEPIEREEFLVPSWLPREAIDAIKSLDVIDPTKVKDAPHSAYSLAPPLKIVCAHLLPLIEGNTPVLAPSLRERVLFEVRFGRGATEPVEHEFIRARENVGAAITDHKRNIAHSRHAAFLGVRLDAPP